MIIHTLLKKHKSFLWTWICKFKDLKLFFTLLAVYMKTDVDINHVQGMVHDNLTLQYNVHVFQFYFYILQLNCVSLCAYLRLLLLVNWKNSYVMLKLFIAFLLKSQWKLYFSWISIYFKKVLILHISQILFCSTNFDFFTCSVEA